MNELKYQKMNGESALGIYEKSLELITIYGEGEENEIIQQNLRVVQDGLEKIVRLKKEELKKKHIQHKVGGN